MKKRIKRTLEKKAAIHVASFLNEHGGTAAGGRIQKLVGLCQEYCADACRVRKQTPENEPVTYPSIALHRKIQAQLHRYRYSLSVNRVVLRRGSSPPDFHYELDTSSHLLRSVRRLKGEEWLAAIAEGQIAPRLLQAMQEDQIKDLRRCEAPVIGRGDWRACNRWFFRPGKLYCGIKCTQRAHEKSPAYRELRAHYMRDLYRREFPSAKERTAMRKYSS